MIECARCGYPILTGGLQCPSCRAWNTGGPSLVSAPPPLVRLGDASVIPPERYQTGFWDRSFGGGIVRTSTILLGGAPGAGKSTLCQSLCDVLSVRTGRDSLYIAAEQSDGEIRTNAERIGVQALNAMIVFRAMNYVATADLPFVLSQTIREIAPVAVIVDSLPELCAENVNLEKRLLKSLKLDAVAMLCPVIILAHVTKEKDIAGIMKHQHTVDGVAIIDHNEKSDLRTLRMKKHRFGGTGVKTVFAMGEHGLIHVPDPENKAPRLRIAD